MMPMRRKVWNFLILLALLMWCGRNDVSAQWSGWRGAESSGVSHETDTPSRIDGAILWSQPLEGGRSTPIIQDGHVYITTRAGRGIMEHERVICYDAETGKIVWEDAVNVFHTTIPGPRVGWANPTGDPETGHVYFHGIEGLLKCYDRDGKVVWSHSLTEEYGRISGYGGRTNTPIVDEGLLILSFLNSSWGSHGKGAHRFVAFDKRSGVVEWWSSPGGRPLDTTYSTPVVAVINGVRQLIVGGADGWVHGLKVRTGEKIWSFQLSKRGINVSPVVAGNHVFVAQSEENVDGPTMGRVVCIDATGSGDITKTGEVWRADEVNSGYASPAVHDGKVYIVDNPGNLHAFDAASGKRLWKFNLGTEGKGSPTIADGKIYIAEAHGELFILEPRDDECRVVAKKQFVRESDGTNNEIFGSCAVANGRVYFTSRDAMICLGEREWKGKTALAPTQSSPAESDIRSNDRPALLLVSPADVTVQPGAPVRFRARLFNDRGQFLREAQSAFWSLKGIRGTINATGEFAVPASIAPVHQGGHVVAKVGSLTSIARVRVIPPLPIKLDFNDARQKKLPAGWIGLSPIKFSLEQLEGERVLNKHGTSQRFARAMAFVGAPDLDEYTIQADVRGTFRRRALPDMGLINQRYRLALMGGIYDRKKKGMKEQVLRVLTWVPQKRLEKDVPFQWQKDTWYRMKMRVESKGDAALIRGKVWLRDDPEPEKWTVEVEDPFPHRAGSPGIYAYTASTTARSRGTDVYFDNLIVEKNQ